MIVGVLLDNNRLRYCVDKRLDEDSTSDQFTEGMRRVLAIANRHQVPNAIK